MCVGGVGVGERRDTGVMAMEPPMLCERLVFALGVATHTLTHTHTLTRARPCPVTASFSFVQILANLYQAMGNTYLALDKPQLAAIHHRKNLDIAEVYGFREMTVEALGNLGRTYRVMHDHTEAIGFFERQVCFFVF